MWYNFVFKNDDQNSSVQEFKVYPFKSYRDGARAIAKLARLKYSSYSMDNFVGVMMSRNLNETNLLMRKRPEEDIYSLIEDKSHEFRGIYV